VNKRPHLLLALSSHGFGHLSQAAPVVNQLRALMPELRMTVRGLFPAEQIKRRIFEPDAIEPIADDFGMVMHHALSVDTEASLAAYLQAHQNWSEKVAALAAHLQDTEVDLVLSDIPYLTLAAAHQAGIPGIALCSLNWADILEHYLGSEDTAKDTVRDTTKERALIATIRSSYQSAQYFLQPAPSMEMPQLTNTLAIGPVCTPGTNQRATLAHNIALPDNAYLVLVGMGGVNYPLSLSAWPAMIHQKPVYYLVSEEMLVVPETAPARLKDQRSTADQDIQEIPDNIVNTISIAQTGLSYSDLVASVELIITKPGYGMFVEAAAAGVPVLYVERPGWPEAPALTDWLQSVAHCAEIDTETLQRGLFTHQLSQLLTRGHYPPVPPNGNLQAAQLIQRLLTQTDSN
jgi:hypothetical protein